MKTEGRPTSPVAANSNEVKTVSGNKALEQATKLIFETGTPRRTGVLPSAFTPTFNQKCLTTFPTVIYFKNIEGYRQLQARLLFLLAGKSQLKAP